jgi:hypothetical protein
MPELLEEYNRKKLNNNMNDYYSEFIKEAYRKDILSGYVTKEHILQAITENTLSDEQKEVVLELMPALAGMRNLAQSGIQGAKNFGQKLAQGASNVASNVSNKVAQAGQNIKNTYNQGKEQQMRVNAIKNFKQTWDNYMSRSLKSMAQTFGNTPDVINAITNMQQWANYLEKVAMQPQQQQQQQQQPQQQQPQQQQQVRQNYSARNPNEIESGFD